MKAMRAEATQGTIHLSFESTFTAPDAERLQGTVLALRPFARLVLDFTAVREFHDSAIPVLASTLNALATGEIVVRGLTMHQWRLLGYFGVDAAAGHALAGAA
jgi:hypothetical protein